MSRGDTEQIDRIKEAIKGSLTDLVNKRFEQHRLAYVFPDEDTPDKKGNPTLVFVCKCKEGFDRSAYNEHIRDRYGNVSED